MTYREVNTRHNQTRTNDCDDVSWMKELSIVDLRDVLWQQARDWVRTRSVQGRNTAMASWKPCSHCEVGKNKHSKDHECRLDKLLDAG